MRHFPPFLSMLALAFVVPWTWAQTEEPCSAEPLHVAEMGSNVAYARNFEAVREAVQRLQNSSNRELDVYTLPVVVHVIHRGSPLGVDENISDAQIVSAIEGMNEDFRKKEGSFGDGLGVDTYIQFELAKRTPEGEPSNGIVRVNGNVIPGYAEHGISNGSDPNAANQSDVKELTTWYGEDYINIFVVPEINGNDGGWGVQGFAFLSPTGDERDGIVVLYNTFGLVGELKDGRDMNRTVVHEMGHHLSLWHTFSNTTSCTSETDCQNQGDEVCDTPSTLSNNMGCNSPVCDGAQVENYMDYTPQECKNTFTAGQRTRMRGCLESVRSSLLESLGGMPVTEHDLTISGLSNVGESTCLPSLAPMVVVTNFGSETVSGFELTTTLNNHATFRTVFPDVVASGESVEVLLPELALSANTNEIAVEVKLLGGLTDDFGNNDLYSQRFDLEAGDYWTLTLNTDTWANEVSWRIEDENGEILMDGGGYEVGASTYTAEGCIPVGCHTLVMEDTNGDGLCAIDFGDDGICDIGGSLTLSNASDSVLLELDNETNNYGFLGTWELCAEATTSLAGCADVNDNGICDEAELEGCQDVLACNFMAGAVIDNGSCEYAETHYDCNGTCLNDTDEDGICDELETEGCTDAMACNFVEAASEDDGTCAYADTHYDCDGNCLSDADQDGVCDELEVSGCTDPTACNYSAEATDSNGNCEYAPPAYNCQGNCLNDQDEDGVCDELEIPGCTDMGANNYNPEATDLDDSCTYDTFGCTDETACNFNPQATEDTGNCIYSQTYYDCEGNCLSDHDNDGICDELEVWGCDIAEACNYQPEATENDGSCEFAESFLDCDGNCLNDVDGDGVCDEHETMGCTDDTACNYDSSATEEDGSCEYPAPGQDCTGTTFVENLDALPALQLFPNPMSPEHALVHISGLENEQTPIRVMGSDGRVVWQGTGIVTSPGIVSYPIRESISPGTYFIQVSTSTPSGNIPLMVW
jgi:hypothetical protein